MAFRAAFSASVGGALPTGASDTMPLERKRDHDSFQSISESLPFFSGGGGGGEEDDESRGVADTRRALHLLQCARGRTAISESGGANAYMVQAQESKFSKGVQWVDWLSKEVRCGMSNWEVEQLE